MSQSFTPMSSWTAPCATGCCWLGRSAFADIDRSGRVTTVGVRLLSGTTTALFDMPASEVCDRGWPLTDVIGAPGRALEQRLAEVPVEDVPAELAAFIANQPRRSRAVDRRVRPLDVSPATSVSPSTTLLRRSA